MLDILLYAVAHPAAVGPEKNVQNKGSQMAGKHYFDIHF